MASPKPVKAGEPHRPPGRPRRADVETRVLDAALELILEQGVEGATTSAIIERSGVARATVYLRWPTHEALMAAAVRRAMGRAPIGVTGDIATDVQRAAALARAIFESRAFQVVFPMIVAGLTGQVAPESRLTYDLLVPGRPRFAAQYRDLATSQGFRADVDGTLVNDMLIGAFVGRYLALGEAPSEADLRQIVDLHLNGLRVRAGQSA